MVCMYFKNTGMIFIFVLSIVFVTTENGFMLDSKLDNREPISLARIQKDRVAELIDVLRLELSRKKTVRYSLYGLIASLGVGLVSYGIYNHFTQNNENNASSSNQLELSKDQHNAIEAEQNKAVARYYESPEQQRTFTGHIKRGAWYGTEVAIGTFVAGLVLSSFAKGQELAGNLIPSIFTSDKNDYDLIYRLIKKDFNNLRESIMVFDIQEQTDQHNLSSDVLYGYFCGQIIDDYLSLIYRLESFLAFILLYGDYKKINNFDYICNCIDILKSSVDNLAISIESVINRLEDMSLALVNLRFKESYFYTMKFICLCGEALYGDAFCPI